MAHIEDHDGTPVFVHEIDGERYSFNFAHVNEERREWLCGVLGRQMDAIHWRAVAQTQKRVKADIRKALGI